MLSKTKIRPYWHVDAKWIFGILLLLTLNLTLINYSLVRVTSEDIAVEMTSTALAVMFSPEGLDSEIDIEEFKEKALENTQEKIQPFPGMNIYITASEISSLTPREIRINLFKQMALPIYNKNISEIIDTEQNPELQDKMESDLGVLSFINIDTHKSLKKALTFMVISAIILAIPFTYFSFNFGRIGNMGLLLFLSSAPGTLLFTILKLSLKGAVSPAHPSKGDSMADVIKYVSSNAMKPVIFALQKVHLNILLFSVSLMILTLTLKIIWQYKNKIKKQTEVTN